MDHSCWPTHFNSRRHIIDSILNASPSTISNLSTNLTNINNESSDSNANEQSINALLSKSTSKVTISKSIRRPSQRATVSLLGTSANSQKLITHNVSFDTSSTTALDGDSLSTCGSESGRFTATNNTTSPSSPNNSDSNGRTSVQAEAIDAGNQNYDAKSLEADSNHEKTTVNANKTEGATKSLNRVHSSSSIDYEKEINKLRQENNMNIEKDTRRLVVESRKRIARPKLITANNINSSRNNSPHFGSLRTNPDYELAATSLTISNSFDMRLKNLENTLTTIENATLNMDACVNDMTCVYQSYDEKLCNESSKDADEFGDDSENLVEIPVAEALAGLSVYDLKPDMDVAVVGIEGQGEPEEEFSGLEDTVSVQSLKTGIQEDMKSSTSVASVHSNLNDSDYLAKFEPGDGQVKQEIRIDNNTKLMIMIKIFEHGEEEKLVKVSDKNVSLNMF